MVNSINFSESNYSILVIDANHSFFRILTIAAMFVYNGAFDIARSVRNFSGCTLLRDVKLSCNEPSDIARYHSLAFT